MATANGHQAMVDALQRGARPVVVRATETVLEETKSFFEVQVCFEIRVGEIIRPVHLLRVFLLTVLESNFPGDPL